MSRNKAYAKVPASFEEMKGTLKDDDKGYCAVIAVAAICKIPTEEARKVLEECGRKRRQGTKRGTTLDALKKLGFKVKVWTAKERRALIASYPGRAVKLENITTHHPRRFPAAWAGQPDMLMFGERHVAAYVDGQVCDWTIKHSMRVCEIWTLEKMT